MPALPQAKDHAPVTDFSAEQLICVRSTVGSAQVALTAGAYADRHPSIIPHVNPWNAAHWSGTSSSGSGVATAAGLCYGLLDSGTGGSIRFPFCHEWHNRPETDLGHQNIGTLAMTLAYAALNNSVGTTIRQADASANSACNS